MSTKEIKPEEWKKFFDAYTKEHKGWKVKFEVLSEDVGAQVIAENLPLCGITADIDNEISRIEIMVGENASKHISHSIANPLRIMLNAPFTGIETLEFETGDGTKTILSLSGLMPDINLKRKRTSDRSLKRNSLL